jgi:hypothetical protein
LDLGDLASRVVLIGGQVLALESRRREGTGILNVVTDTGVEVTRGFTYEPDLLFELEGDEFMAERLLEVLGIRGYRRVRDFRWAKRLAGGVDMSLDLFAPPGVERQSLPSGMTPLPDEPLVVRGKYEIKLNVGEMPLRIAVPDAAGFLAMKIRAKREQRPRETKDCFDIFAYVKLVGTEAVLASLARAGHEGRIIQARLVDLFRVESAAGVQDVLAYAGSLTPEEQGLLAQAAVDLFSDF